MKGPGGASEGVHAHLAACTGRAPNTHACLPQVKLLSEHAGKSNGTGTAGRNPMVAPGHQQLQQDLRNLA